jgi:hypothetical protein
MRGPRGPSGVTETQPPAASVRAMTRSACTAPRELDPAIVRTPKCAMVREIRRPSWCSEISRCIGAGSVQILRAISIRPCQKHPISGRPDSRRRAICSLPIRVVLLVAKTRRMYRAASQATVACTGKERSKRFTPGLPQARAREAAPASSGIGLSAPCAA